MKKFILILVIIVSLAVAGIGFLFYQTIDEESYKAQVIASTRELLGREMAVKGPVTIKLFPSPVITLTDIEIQNKTGFQSKKLMTIDKIEAHIQFSSLFQNPLVVQNVTLTHPEIYLEKNKQGNINWDLAFLTPSNRLVNKDDTLGELFTEVPPQFQNMQIEDGSITYLNQTTDSSIVLTKIKGKIKTQSIKGPFDFAGSLNLNNIPLTANLYIDKLNADVETKFNLKISGMNSKAVLSVQDGKLLRFAEPMQEIYGPFTFTAPKLSDFLLESKGFKNLPPELNQEIIGNGQFRFSNQAMKFDEMAIRYGSPEEGMAVSGSLSFIYPTNPQEQMKTDAVLHFSQLDADVLLPYIDAPKDWEKTLFSIQNVLPNNLDFTIDSSRTLLYKQAMTGLSLKGSYKNKILEILNLDVTLPEKTTLKASGSLNPSAENPSIDLAVTVKSTDLQPTLTWANITLPVVKNTAALHDVEASAEIRVRPKDLSIDKIKMSAGEGQMSGSVSVSLTEPTLTGIAKLELASINFDNLIPYTAPTQDVSFKEWLTSVKTYLESSKLLGDASFSLNITGNDITFKNLPIQKFTYEGKFGKSEWETSQLKIDQIATANIRYSGKISKSAEGALSFTNVAFDLEMPKSMLLLDRIKVKSPFATTIGKVYTKAIFNGNFDKLNVVSETSFSQGHVNFDGTIEGVLTDTPNYNLKAKIIYPSFHQFVRLFNPVYKGLPNLTGAFAFDGSFVGNQNAFALKNTTASVGAQKLEMNLGFEKKEETFSVNGNITSPLLYMDKFVANKNALSQVNAKTGKSQFSKDLLDFSSLDDLNLDIWLAAQKLSFENWEVENFKTHILLNQKILTLEEGLATVDNGKIGFSTLLNSSTATPFLKGQLNVQNIPVRADLLTLGMFRLKNGTLSFTSNFNAKGNSFDDMINSLSATGALNVKNGTISGLNIASFERRIQSMVARNESFENSVGTLNKEMTIGETAFDSLSGTYAITNGLLRSSDVVFKSPIANAITQMDFDLSEWKLSSSSALTLKDLTGYPSISVVIKGSAHTPQTNIDLASFIKHIQSTATDARNQLLRQQKEKEDLLRRTEAKDRVKHLQDLFVESENQILQAEDILKIVSTQTAQTELIRAKDAFALLQELAQKPVPSDADVEKASVQAAMIKSRTQTILTNITERATIAMKEKLEKISTTAREKMTAIHRIHQNLPGVEQIEQAYQKAFSAMTIIQNASNSVENSINLAKMQALEKQVEDALDILDLTYQSIAKFDLDAQQPYEEDPQETTMQGSIQRS